MSDRSWNRGLDDAANGEFMRQNQDEDYYAGFAYGQPVIQQPYPPEPEPEPEQYHDPPPARGEGMSEPVKYRIADYAGWFSKQRPDVKQPLDIFLAHDVEKYVRWLLGFKHSEQIRRELEQFMSRQYFNHEVPPQETPR